MNDERDEMIERAARVLRTPPQVRSGTVARVLMAVRARHARPASRWQRALWWVADTSISARGAAVLAAASLAIGFVARGTVATSEPIVVASGPSIELQPVADGDAAERPVPVALVFEQANARDVAVVGDFNGWDRAASPMVRAGTEGPWTATVLAKPGRHTYAFIVDGTTLVADPNAAKATSNDFRGDASVMIVRPD
ncbi:MAG: hypothetical protein FJ202_00450 [Gemmatimonadetes bacterium]|nr:hypothetical protein [Gemmatimonadota bacterium]